WDGVIGDDVGLSERIAAIPGVLAASASVEMRVLVEKDRRVVAPIVVGVEPDRVGALHPQLAAKLTAGKLDLTGDNVLLGIDLARELNVTAGDTIVVYSPMNLVSKDEVFFPEEFVVGGIFNLGQRDFDSGFVIASLGAARDLMGLTGGAYAIHVKTAHPENPRLFAADVDRLREALGPDYNVRTWREVDRELFAALAVEKNMMVILLMFITVVAIFCVTITLIVITVQKTHEIGLLKALGFSSRQIMWTFVLYGWIQCLTGTVLGVGLAFTVLHNLQRLVDRLAYLGLQVFPKNIYGLDEIPWRVLPEEVVQVALSVIVFCTLASIVPAGRAARLDPVEALRG
ncbi:MAG: ABC transporter permease, partial [Kiritimatiellae bacterium]|nr:ABC transporter permease [Kiritimatiellia bacterium]